MANNKKNPENEKKKQEIIDQYKDCLENYKNTGRISGNLVNMCDELKAKNLYSLKTWNGDIIRKAVKTIT